MANQFHYSTKGNKYLPCLFFGVSGISIKAFFLYKISCFTEISYILAETLHKNSKESFFFYHNSSSAQAKYVRIT